MFTRLRFLIKITRATAIARRYFVTNGFDGALTMLGLNMGFYSSGNVSHEVMLGACTGTAIALAASGITSAYISEAAEKEKELGELEQAMVKDLGASAHGQAARFVPWVIALVNGLSPLVLAFLIITPLWLPQFGVVLPVDPAAGSLAMAFVVIFFLGVFLGNLSGRFWLWAGLRAVSIALVTAVIIMMV